ncbi:helix-turn-helix domain-containing protein [Streptacidiphilus griseoplanus]|uniref:helix-turn-helix domain-containing protein n=1 Tax=Peterkaempfera griseoplana TaxID=66896 RepID=UPI0006E4610D|nr:helix-turn-helix transcriptional regulator [Peterkaempfera griseoplana]
MADQGGRSVADRLDHLFKTRHPSGRGPYTIPEVAELTARYADSIGDPSAKLSASAIQKIRNGTKSNPTTSTLKALARAFGVRASYFIDDEPPAEAGGEAGSTAAALAELEALMRDNNVRNIAMRANGLSEETLHLLAGFIERARTLEGLKDEQA